MKRHLHKSRQISSGFTLIEVLIALSLSVMLISAVYAAIEMHYRFQSAGRAEIRGQQLIRSLTRLIARDISCVTLELPEETEADSGQAADEQSGTSAGVSNLASGSTFDAALQNSNSSSSSEEMNGIADAFLGLSEGVVPAVFGIYGTPDILHMTVNLPSREMDFFPLGMETTVDDRTSHLKIVTLALTEIDSLGMTMLQKNLKVTRPGVGLGRRVRSFYTTASGEEPLEPHHLISPEVTELAFRYFDSGEWFESWDSTQMGRLPRAIEVRFGVWNPPPVQVGRDRSTEPGTVTDVVYVFKVPLSEPTVE